MSERCPDCGYFKQEYNADPEFDCVNTGDINCESRALKLLRARLTKLEAVVEAAKGTVEAAKEMRNYTTGSEIAFITRDWFDNEVRAYDAAKAELEKVER